MLNVRLEWKLEDFWVGVFWRKTRVADPTDPLKLVRRVEVWVCLVPCVPIHVTWTSVEDALAPDPRSLGCYFCRTGKHGRCVRLPEACFCRSMNHQVKF